MPQNIQKVNLSRKIGNVTLLKECKRSLEGYRMTGITTEITQFPDADENIERYLTEIHNLHPDTPQALIERWKTHGRITHRIDDDTHTPRNFLVEKPPFPESVKIELTGRCNWGCKFCGLITREKQPKKEDQMPMWLFRKIVDEMAENGVKKFGLFLIDEPFMNVPLLVECISYVKSKGLFTFITSNGTLATPKNVKKVFEAGLDSLKFSLTTNDDEQFEAIIGVKVKQRHQAMKHMESTMKIRNEGGYACELSASWIDFKDDQRRRMAETVKSVKNFFDTIYGLPLYAFGDLAVEGQQESGMHAPVPGNIGRLANQVSPKPCWLVFHKMHVLHDGRLTLCAFDAGRLDHSWAVGNLKNYSVAELWHSDQAVALRRAHLAKGGAETLQGTPCENCAAYG